MTMPKSGVMRLAKSKSILVSLTDGSKLVFRCETVGSDISSATNGSSVDSVAGKKRRDAAGSENQHRQTGAPRERAESATFQCNVQHLSNSSRAQKRGSSIALT